MSFIYIKSKINSHKFKKELETIKEGINSMEDIVLFIKYLFTTEKSNNNDIEFGINILLDIIKNSKDINNLNYNEIVNILLNLQFSKYDKNLKLLIYLYFKVLYILSRFVKKKQKIRIFLKTSYFLEYNNDKLLEEVVLQFLVKILKNKKNLKIYKNNLIFKNQKLLKMLKLKDSFKYLNKINCINKIIKSRDEYFLREFIVNKYKDIDYKLLIDIPDAYLKFNFNLYLEDFDVFEYFDEDEFKNRVLEENFNNTTNLIDTNNIDKNLIYTNINNIDKNIDNTNSIYKNNICCLFLKNKNSIINKKIEMLRNLNNPLFLRIYNLDKIKLGKFLTKSENENILKKYLKTFNFKKDLLESLREFLGSFLIPGESQIVIKILTLFSDEFYLQNKTNSNRKDININLSIDSIYILCFSLVTLNTNIHNFNVKKKITKLEFLERNKKCKLNEYFNEEYQIYCYNSIKESEIKIYKNYSEEYKIYINCLFLFLKNLNNINDIDYNIEDLSINDKNLKIEENSIDYNLKIEDLSINNNNINDIDYNIEDLSINDKNLKIEDLSINNNNTKIKNNIKNSINLKIEKDKNCINNNINNNIENNIKNVVKIYRNMIICKNCRFLIYKDIFETKINKFKNNTIELSILFKNINILILETIKISKNNEIKHFLESLEFINKNYNLIKNIKEETKVEFYEIPSKTNFNNFYKFYNLTKILNLELLINLIKNNKNEIKIQILLFNTFRINKIYKNYNKILEIINNDKEVIEKLFEFFKNNKELEDLIIKIENKIIYELINLQQEYLDYNFILQFLNNKIINTISSKDNIENLIINLKKYNLFEFVYKNKSILFKDSSNLIKYYINSNSILNNKILEKIMLKRDNKCYKKRIITNITNINSYINNINSSISDNINNSISIKDTRNDNIKDSDISIKESIKDSDINNDSISINDNINNSISILIFNFNEVLFLINNFCLLS